MYQIQTKENAIFYNQIESYFRQLELASAFDSGLGGQRPWSAAPCGVGRAGKFSAVAGRPPLRQLSLGGVRVRWPRSTPSRPVVRALSPASGSPRTAAATHIPSGTAHTAGRNDGTRRRGADGVHSAVITDGHRG